MKTDSNERKSYYLSFKLDKEIFAVSVYKVLEVLQKQNVTQVPKAPEYIRGVINFRGEILPVVETRTKFNMPEREEDGKYVIIVLDLQINGHKLILGAMADGVKDVLEIKEEDIKDVPEMGSNYNTEFMEGMLKVDEGFIMVLDIDKVFSVEDVALFEGTAYNESMENLIEEE
jgi:purine-binding chemotaxis protein CheW